MKTEAGGTAGCTVDQISASRRGKLGACGGTGRVRRLAAAVHFEKNSKNASVCYICYRGKTSAKL